VKRSAGVQMSVVPLLSPSLSFPLWHLPVLKDMTTERTGDRTQ